MTRRLLAAALLVGAAWVGVLAPAAVRSAPACASGGPHAALVVATGAGTPRAYCVALDAPEVSGLHLIVLAHEQHGLSYAFGNGGLAICQLAGVGSVGERLLRRLPRLLGVLARERLGRMDVGLDRRGLGQHRRRRRRRVGVGDR